jgi:hypothetical protein
VPAKCGWCDGNFEIKYGTLYNVIRRNAEGIYCSRKCAGSGRAFNTQNKYQSDGGKVCKRCGEFKKLENFSKLPNPPYYRSECRRCHNHKPVRIFSIYKEKAQRDNYNFDISIEYFESFWNKECFYCATNIKKVRIELLEKTKGYIKDNIVSCCRRCQKFKGDLEHSEFIELCHKISLNVKKLEDK